MLQKFCKNGGLICFLWCPRVRVLFIIHLKCQFGFQASKRNSKVAKNMNNVDPSCMLSNELTDLQGLFPSFSYTNMRCNRSQVPCASELESDDELLAPAEAEAPISPVTAAIARRNPTTTNQRYTMSSDLRRTISHPVQLPCLSCCRVML